MDVVRASRCVRAHMRARTSAGANARVPEDAGTVGVHERALQAITRMHACESSVRQTQLTSRAAGLKVGGCTVLALTLKSTGGCKAG
eukprot:7024980-Alexandrium_andersonii.AAC.1